MSNNIKYLEDGTKVKVVHENNYYNMCVVKEFDKTVFNLVPPEELYDQNPLEVKVNELKEELEQLEQRKDKLNEIVKNHEIFNDEVLMFLNNTYQYVLIKHYRHYTLHHIKDSVLYYEKQRRPISLINTLTEDNSLFKINQYSDGSGSFQNCWLFDDYDVAKEKFKEHLYEYINSYNKKSIYEWDVKQLIEQCKEHNI